MTNDQRIEAAARAMAHAERAYANPSSSANLFWQHMATAALAAAYPELNGEKLSHWLAPMEAPRMFREAYELEEVAQEHAEEDWAEIRLACLEDLNTQEEG